VVAVVADGHVAPRGESEGAVDEHLFAGGLAEGFGPFKLRPAVSPRISLLDT